MAGRPLELSVVDEGEQNDQEPRIGDYERLLGDAMAGDATLFARIRLLLCVPTTARVK